jgi:hypothetical protein
LVHHTTPPSSLLPSFLFILLVPRGGQALLEEVTSLFGHLLLILGPSHHAALVASLVLIYFTRTPGASLALLEEVTSLFGQDFCYVRFIYLPSSVIVAPHDLIELWLPTESDANCGFSDWKLLNFSHFQMIWID